MISLRKNVSSMLRIALVRPGSTAFDEQGRIKGALDIPLSDSGNRQVSRTLSEMSGYHFDAVYSAPCESARETATQLAELSNVRSKSIEALANLDHGLWQGKLIDEVRLQQPKVYRKFQEDPGAVRPPGGETVAEAKMRIEKVLRRWLKRHQDETIAAVIPEPLASIFRLCVIDGRLGDLWQSECDNGRWEMLTVTRQQVLASS